MDDFLVRLERVARVARREPSPRVDVVERVLAALPAPAPHTPRLLLWMTGVAAAAAAGSCAQLFSIVRALRDPLVALVRSSAALIP